MPTVADYEDRAAAYPDGFAECVDCWMPCPMDADRCPDCTALLAAFVRAFRPRR